MIPEKILIVDDEKTVCDSVNKIFSRKGYTVEDSLNATEAMEKIKSTTYDLIITDMKMPGIGGLELLELVKDYYPELEVILITGYPSADTADKAKELGAADYISKPFTPDELIETAERALKKRKRLEEEIQKIEKEEKEEYDIRSKALNIAVRWDNKPENIIEMMHDIQSEFNYLPKDILFKFSEYTKVPVSKIYSIASFYNAFSLDPKGKHRISVCMGTACHVQGAQKVLDNFKTKLKINEGETTEDLKYSLDAVRCVGCCGLAAVITIDKDLYGQVRLGKLDKILKSYN